MILELLLLAAPSLELTLVAPEGCPTEPAVRAAVEALTPIGSGPPALAVVVQVEGPPWRAGLIFETDDGPPESRDVSGESCAAVIDAAALIISLRLEALPPPPPPPPPTAPPPVPRTPFHPTLVEPAPTPGGRPTFFSMTLTTGGLFGVQPDPGFGLGLALAYTDGALRLELGGLYLLSQTQSVGDFQARYRSWSGRARACHRQPFFGADLLTCGQVSIGLLEAEGRQVDTPARVRPLWLAAGGGLEAVLPLQERIRAVPGVSIEIPLSRPRFTLDDPDRVVHRPAPWVVGLTFSVEVVF